MYALQQLWAGEASVPEMAAAIGSASLLASVRVVVLHSMDRMGAREQQPLAPVLENIPPGTLVIITTRPPAERRDRKPPLSASILKVAAAVGDTQVHFTPNERDLVSWVTDEFTAQGGSIALAAARRLVEITGADCDRLVNEIDKLISYAGPGNTVDVLAVEMCASPADDRGVFELVDAIGQRDVATALEILNVLLPPNAPRGAVIPLLGMITRQLRLLWQLMLIVRENGSFERNLPENLTARLPVNQNIIDTMRGDFMLRKLTAQARNFRDGHLARALLRVYEADLAAKGQGDLHMDDRMIAETLVVSLCRPT